MTNSNASQPTPETNPSTHASIGDRRKPVIAAIAAFCVGALLAGGIVGGFAYARQGQTSGGEPGGSTTTTAADSCDTTFTVVASVNQWGSLAEQLGGSCAEVTSLINSTSADPHDYEATASDLAKLAKADIVVLNGAGYDGWAEKAQLNPDKQTIVNVGDLMGITATEEHSHEHEEGEEGHHHHHGSTNPHVWFSPEGVLKAAEAINDAYVTKAGENSKTAEEYKQYYDTGYKTDVEKIVIKGDQMSFTRGGKTATATYKYDGFKILDYAKGNRGVRFLFTATGDVPEGAPKIVQFSDHGIAPGKSAHFHIFMGDASQKETLKEMDNWPTYYPASMSGEEIATEILAH
ncbi:ABC superfamily ATP binding cassette transporter, binding protein [Bifidobacterium reuteri DSM 23975]|uniref:ABC superfamily ATP binding cassette transporter, binding protein n=1 Tax=Bifidobacterium reuteri DSM 23975 TaxID=1437610 RepID=A0A087CXB5_9BIFI|nr:ZinT/AdcA family metal-binding protein [Bifidobacterium reuteri]KFI87915.1 ABC superfamily ATP binding cassette transporter, binding protein [Bifidobacterium reuteri DSM 23975]